MPRWRVVGNRNSQPDPLTLTPIELLRQRDTSGHGPETKIFDGEMARPADVSNHFGVGRKMENVLTRKEASPMKSGTSEDQTVAPYERIEEIAEILARAAVHVLLSQRLPKTLGDLGNQRLSSPPTDGSL